MENTNYTIRAYAIVQSTENDILLMDETYRGITFTKFPGGGLEWGEGLAECLTRELAEELGLMHVAFTHFYTTDFFEQSYFDSNTQVLCVYYKLNQKIEKKSIVVNTADKNLMGAKWVPLASLKQADVSFAIDKKVVELLTETRLSLVV